MISNIKSVIFLFGCSGLFLSCDGASDYSNERGNSKPLPGFEKELESNNQLSLTGPESQVDVEVLESRFFDHPVGRIGEIRVRALESQYSYLQTIYFCIDLCRHSYYPDVGIDEGYIVIGKEYSIKGILRYSRIYKISEFLRLPDPVSTTAVVTSTLEDIVSFFSEIESRFEQLVEGFKRSMNELESLIAAQNNRLLEQQVQIVDFEAEDEAFRARLEDLVARVEESNQGNQLELIERLITLNENMLDQSRQQIDSAYNSLLLGIAQTNQLEAYKANFSDHVEVIDYIGEEIAEYVGETIHPLLEKRRGILTQPAGSENVWEMRVSVGYDENWNTPDTAIELFHGETLRIYFDGAIGRSLHTQNSPCPHSGNRIFSADGQQISNRLAELNEGAYLECDINIDENLDLSSADQNSLYNHANPNEKLFGKFFVAQ